MLHNPLHYTQRQPAGARAQKGTAHTAHEIARGGARGETPDARRKTKTRQRLNHTITQTAYRPIVIGVRVLLASAKERCVGKVLLPAAAAAAAVGKFLLNEPSKGPRALEGAKPWSASAPTGRTPRIPLEAVRALGCSRRDSGGARLAARPFGQNA